MPLDVLLPLGMLLAVVAIAFAISAAVGVVLGRRLR